MESLFSTGSKQTDLEIFKYIDDKDIRNVCMINKYANKLLNDEKFWIARFFYVYGKYLGQDSVKRFKIDKTWKRYYIDVKKYIEYPFPFYSSALALSLNRHDILQILSNIFKIQNVKPVMEIVNDSFNYYYTRDGTHHGIKEGVYYRFDASEIEKIGKININIISKIANRKEKIYNGNIIQSAITYYQNNKISEKIYIDGEIVKSIKYNKNGNKVFEQIVEGTCKVIKEWFINGDIKSESSYIDDKKNGVWNKWNKKGEKVTKYYSEGKLVPYITPLKETLEIHEYFCNLRDKYQGKK